MNAISALTLAIAEWNGISGETESVFSESGFFAGRHDGPFAASEIIEAINDSGETCTIDDPETLAGIVGVIYSISEQGFRDTTIYTNKSEFKNDWRDYENEYNDWEYDVANGHMITITDGSGKQVAFLQDEDGSKLVDELEKMEEYQVQETLRLYGEN